MNAMPHIPFWWLSFPFFRVQFTNFFLHGNIPPPSLKCFLSKGNSKNFTLISRLVVTHSSLLFGTFWIHFFCINVHWIPLMWMWVMFMNCFTMHMDPMTSASYCGLLGRCRWWSWSRLPFITYFSIEVLGIINYYLCHLILLILALIILHYV